MIDHHMKNKKSFEGFVAKLITEEGIEGDKITLRLLGLDS